MLEISRDSSKLHKKHSALKGAYPALQKTWNCVIFFYFCESFLTSWIRIRNTDPLSWLNADPIRIRIRNTAHLGFSGYLLFLFRLKGLGLLRGVGNAIGLAHFRVRLLLLMLNRHTILRSGRLLLKKETFFNLLCFVRQTYWCVYPSNSRFRAWYLKKKQATPSAR